MNGRPTLSFGGYILVAHVTSTANVIKSTAKVWSMPKLLSPVYSIIVLGPSAHVADVARLYRLALEKGSAGARYYAVAEEGVPLKDIATAIGRGLNVPVISISQEQAQGHFGFLGFFAGRDAHISSAQTRAKLGWNPTGPTLLTDLGNMHYSQN